MAAAPTRPVVRWHGGKWRLAPWIVAHLPPHRVYTEAYGGGGSVLLRKPRVHAEVWNDLDDDVVGLFRVLRDPVAADELVRRLELTPFARSEFRWSFDIGADSCAIERARALVIRSFQGFGSNAHAGHSTGFRANSSRSGTTPAGDWANYPDALRAVVARLRGVVVENRPALEVIATHDSPDTLHYVDPPYLWETRQLSSGAVAPKNRYRYEMDAAQHADLLAALRDVSGMVVLSGYPDDRYDTALPQWRRVERAAFADGARPRTEVLWINPRAWGRLMPVLPFPDREVG